jgi:hypothetical protein
MMESEGMTECRHLNTNKAALAYSERLLLPQVKHTHRNQAKSEDRGNTTDDRNGAEYAEQSLQVHPHRRQ